MKSTVLSCLLVIACLFPASHAQGSQKGHPYSFSFEAGWASKYLWRGQRLTNDWSLQPSMTVGAKGFSFNVWGTMDLTAVNEGDSLLLPPNPAALPGQNGLKGKFSEVDYTLSYARSFADITVDVGTIFYTFPERSASLPSTTEVYLGVSLDSVPLAPFATLYIDIDETGRSGDGGLYFLVGAGHAFSFPHDFFPGVDISTSLAFANGGFGDFYYGTQQSGAHDFNVTFSLPINLGGKWSASTFLTYTALLGNFRDHQYLDPRSVLRGTAGLPASVADTIWGGFTVSLEF